MTWRNSHRAFDHFSASYERHVEDPIKIWFGGNGLEYYLRVKANEILQHLRRLNVDPQKLKALDMGCGTGMLAQMLSQEFSALQGADASEGMVRRTKALGLPGVFFHVGDARALPFESNQFDLIYSSCLLHHVPQESQLDILKEMVRVLRPGGWVFIFEHNPLNPVTRLVVKRCEVDEGVRLLSAGRLTSLFHRADLERIHRRHILFFPAQIRFLRFLEPYLFWCPLGGQFYVCGQKAG